MDMWIVVPWLLSIVLLAVFIAAREMVMFKLKWMLKKKKSGIPSIVISEDKNVKIDVVSTNDDGEIRSDEGPKKQKKVAGEKTYWFEPFDSRLIFEREGDADIFDPFEDEQGSSITADTIDRIAKRAKLQGAIDKENSMKQMMVLLIIAVVLSGITALLIFLTMQSVGDVQGVLEQMARRPVEQTIQNGGG